MNIASVSNITNMFIYGHACFQKLIKLSNDDIMLFRLIRCKSFYNLLLNDFSFFVFVEINLPEKLWTFHFFKGVNSQIQQGINLFFPLLYVGSKAWPCIIFPV